MFGAWARALATAGVIAGLNADLFATASTTLGLVANFAAPRASVGTARTFAMPTGLPDAIALPSSSHQPPSPTWRAVPLGFANTVELSRRTAAMRPI
ncbi:hypothetical protein D3C86_1715010 [compost metagenome]